MNFLKASFLFLSLFISAQCLCQNKLVKVKLDGYKYQYKGVKYKEPYLPSLFKDNKEASKLYKAYKSEKLVGTTFGIICLGTVSIGTFVLAQQPSEKGVEKMFRISIVGAITGVLGLLVNSNAKNKRKKAIEVFNQGLSSSPDIGMTSIKLNFGLTTNGVGISVIF